MSVAKTLEIKLIEALGVVITLSLWGAVTQDVNGIFGILIVPLMGVFVFYILWLYLPIQLIIWFVFRKIGIVGSIIMTSAGVLHMVAALYLFWRDDLELFYSAIPAMSVSAIVMLLSNSLIFRKKLL